jgi:uncharacterized protein (DUF1501 family)
MNRRSFLRNGTCGMMSSLPAINTILNMTLANNLAQAQGTPGEDYKALICLFFNGGNDSYNMLIPTTPEEFGWYELTRSNVGLEAPSASGAPYNPNAALPLNVTNTPGRTFAIHPSMPDVADLFNQGNASFIANIGTLVEPVPSVAAFNTGIYRIPVSTGAHNTQQTAWQTGLPQFASSNTGWFGRTADIINLRKNPASSLPMSFSLSSTKGINQGVQNSGLAIGQSGINLLDNSNFKDKWMKNKFEAQQNRIYQNIMQRVHRDKIDEYSDLANTFQVEYNKTNTATAFSGGLSATFKSIARTIAMRNVFNVKRQTFFIGFGNFDGHSNLVTSQKTLLSEVNLAIKEFWAEMGNKGLQDKVTIFTGSDFGRTLRSNGSGTDHAWGGNAFVIGGALNGGKILGNYPSILKLGDGLDLGTNGRLLPTTGVDPYYADLLLWFGVQKSELSQALPNIGNFYDISSTSPPLGLFA